MKHQINSRLKNIMVFCAGAGNAVYEWTEGRLKRRQKSPFSKTSGDAHVWTGTTLYWTNSNK